MKELFVRIIKSLVPKIIRLGIVGYLSIYKHNNLNSKIEALIKGKLIYPHMNIDYKDDYARQFCCAVKRMTINVDSEYIYPYDTLLQRLFKKALICSITVDFQTVLEADLNNLRDRIKKVKDGGFKNRELSTINSIEELSRRIIKLLQKKNTSRSNVLIQYFDKMLYRTPHSLDEAVQKILFYDALFWQMGHRHIGLGRLDYILYPYYNNDISTKSLTRDDAKNIIKNMILILGKDTKAKSPSIIGDTGQYIMLGGINKNDENVENELTRIILEIMADIKIPDPKLILRANTRTDDAIWQASIKCLITGIGSPLIMDEKLIMRKMKLFGYNENDVWNVGTSACWEPLIIGKSFDQNNPFSSAVAIRPLNKIIMEGANYNSFDHFYNSYKNAYKEELYSVIKDIDFDCSTLFTLFFDSCIEREKDFSCGGADYSYHGAQVVSLPNTVNALLNIKELVFEKHIVSLLDCKKAIISNFEGMNDLQLLLINTEKKFGSTDELVVSLTNDLIAYTGMIAESLKCNGFPIKIGFSSPNYIGESRDFPASLDGRKCGDPFAVHISPLSAKIDISEILDFSSKLCYPNNCLNGNVVDFILPSSYLKCPEKFISILKNACNNGFFELQLNVMDKETLIDAKLHPERYPNLIVRVWGFSAYFNDLPEEFKDNLIRRAEIYEAA